MPRGKFTGSAGVLYVSPLFFTPRPRGTDAPEMLFEFLETDQSHVKPAQVGAMEWVGVRLTRALMGLRIFHHLMGGGVLLRTPPPL